jgi:hypothetical protein
MSYGCHVTTFLLTGLGVEVSLKDNATNGLGASRWLLKQALKNFDTAFFVL